MKQDTDAEWEKWGKQDPYYGVITIDKYRRENFDDSARREFFDSGRRHMKSVLETCRRHLDPAFQPVRTLDFGCGTGRLLIPLAEMYEHATGVDVSDSMLQECRRNCDRYSIDNVDLVKSDNDLTMLNGRFDLIHSFIVFQHIPIDRGRRLICRLMEHLEAGGIGALHLTYGKSCYADKFGFPPNDTRSPTRKLMSRIKNQGRRAIKRTLEKPDQGEAAADPEMQMNAYLLNEIFFIIQAAGAKAAHVQFTDHTGDLGIYVFFQKAKQP